MADTMRLQATGIDKRYGAVHSLRQVDFHLREGEVVALLGENGAGKSTFVKVLSGLVRPDSGRIEINGATADLSSSVRAQAAGIAVVQQEFSTVPALSVAENLMLGKASSPFLWTARRRRTIAERLLPRVGLGDVDPETPVSALSVAETQLLEIARALADDARIVIFDEPTAALSESDAQRVLQVVRELADSGVSVVYVTHRLPEVFAIADRIAVFRNGVSLPSVPIGEASIESVIGMMLGREFGSMFPPRADQLGEEQLRVDELLVPGLASPVSLSARRGEILGLTGQIGSGADAVVKAIAGEVRILAGSVMIEGRPMTARTRAQGLAQGVTYCSPDRKRDGIFAGKSIEVNLSSSWIHDVAQLGLISPRRERASAIAAARDFSIDLARMRSSVGQLSGGNQQKVALAKWLGNSPRVFLVEEPTRGVDVGARSDIYTKLRGLCDEGMTVVVVSSDTAEVRGLCDTIATFYHGELTAVAPWQEWTEDALAAAVMNRSGS